MILLSVIGKTTYCFIKRNGSDDHIEAYFFDLEELNEFRLEDIPIKQYDNAFLVCMCVCVCIEIIKRGAKVKGFDVVFVDDVLLGIVLPSLAALESYFGFALNKMYNMGFDHLELVKIGQH